MIKVPNNFAAIHALTANLGMDDEEYRNMLYDLYGKRSSKELTLLQQTELIGNLRKQLGKSGGRWSGLKRSNPLMATARQLRYVEAMWSGVSRMETAEAKEHALRSFCRRITGIDMLEWLRKTDVRKLIKAMEAMRVQTPKQRSEKFQPITLT